MGRLFEDPKLAQEPGTYRAGLALYIALLTVLLFSVWHGVSMLG